MFLYAGGYGIELIFMKSITNMSPFNNFINKPILSLKLERNVLKLFIHSIKINGNSLILKMNDSKLTLLLFSFHAGLKICVWNTLSWYYFQI